MESQDKEKEYEHSVWEIYRKEWATASSEKKVELNKRMRRWQELMKDGLTASQAHYRVMQEESDYKVTEELSDTSLSYSLWAKMRKAPFTVTVMGFALVAAIVYGFIITGDRNALNTELESVQSTLASTRIELSSAGGALSSVQTELSSTKQTLVSTETELSSTKQMLTSTNQRLSSVQSELGATKAKLDAIEAKLKLYEDTLGIKIFSGVQEPPLRGASPIKLVNNPAATDPSWQQLISFLRADPTDDRTWTEGIFVSGDFAQMLHNNAEAAGIRAAWVGVFFEGKTIGHGLNAFKTTDRGLVYVDSTGPTLSQSLDLEWDKIAYVVKGKQYASISLGQNTPLDYDSYTEMKADWDIYDRKLEAYNKEVKEFNREIFLKVYYIGTPEWERIKEWERTLEGQKRELDSMRAQLEYVWGPMGIVEGIKIYW